MDRPDNVLVAEALRGRLESFDEIMRRHERIVYRVAFLYGGSRESALDISQNAFIKAYQALRSFRGESSFRTWLLRIVENEGLGWARSQARRDRQLEPVPVEPAAPAAQEVRLLSRERRRILDRKIAELNPRQRLAVTLRYFRQMPLSEIAGVLQCSENHVKNVLFRSVRKLRQSLAGSGLEECP